MNSSFPYQQTKALLLEYLYTNRSGQFSNVVTGVIELAVHKDLYQKGAAKSLSPGTDYRRLLDGNDREYVPELLREIMWQLLVQNIVVFGLNESNPNFPWYRLTSYGEKVIEGVGPQPYDPDNFLDEFKNKNPNADSVIFEYLTEAVNAFNHDCQKASSVMLGAASEKAILLLFDIFLSKIKDVTKKNDFERDVRWSISSKFNTLHDRLLKMVNSKTLDRNLNDIVNSDLPGVFNLVRRQRNSAGHPELLSNIDKDSNFLNLRIFSEYINCIYKLIDYFNKNDADW